MRIRPSKLRTLAGALLFLLCGPCLAEVGVIYSIDFSAQPRGPYQLRGIIDDGEPVLSAWQVFSSYSDSRYILNILHQRSRPKTEPGALHLTRREDLLEVDLPEPDLGPYHLDDLEEEEGKDAS